MKIEHKNKAQRIEVSNTLTVFEYPLMDERLHGAVIELSGRYPESGTVMNEVCTEIAFVIKGSGILVVGEHKVNFETGDQILIKPGEKYFWDAKATLFMPCTPAWYPEQHKEVK